MSIVDYPVTTPWAAMEVLVQVKAFMQLRFKFYIGLNMSNTIGIHCSFLCSVVFSNYVLQKIGYINSNYLK